MSTPATPGDDALKRIESYQYPRAHYNHLNAAQNKALEDFKAICAKEGYYSSASGDHKASHDDETLLRYLRARKFVPKDAFGQFKDTEDWRKQNKIPELYQTIDVEDYDEARKLYPQWTGRRDKRGIPVYVFEVAGLTAKTMAKYEQSTSKAETPGNVSAKLLRLFALYENLTQFVLPLCSAVPGRPYEETPVSQSNNIVDISRVGLKQFWNLKGHMQDASQLATAHYPETLDRIFIIGAPSFFPTVWNWIKKWFDPITVSKIFILSQRDMQTTLKEYIDEANIPTKYGGTLEWGWGDLPNLEPAISDSLSWKNPATGPQGQKGFPAGPIAWKESHEGKTTAFAVGSLQGKPRNNEIATVKARRMNTNNLHLKIDPPLGPVSSGLHTHPKDTDEYFPKSGDTPTDEHDEPDIPTSARASETSPEQAASAVLHAGPEDSHPRQGTSKTKLIQQDQTLAKGQMSDGTPATVDQGNGDKTVTMEPATVGQAPKDVSVPDRTLSEPEQSKTYVESAMAAAGSAAGVVGSAGTALMSAVGLGGQKSATEETKEPEVKPQDERIDRVHTRDVEDFIRSQTESKPVEAPR